MHKGEKSMNKFVAVTVAAACGMSVLAPCASALDEYSIFWDSGGLYINGRTDSENANAAVSVTDEDGKMYYADQTKSGTDGVFTFSAPIPYSEGMTVRLADASSGETVTENSESLAGGIEIYPEYPDIVARNTDFAVTVSKDGKTVPLTVYDVGGTITYSDTTVTRHRRFCEFAVKGGAEVTVKPNVEYETYDVIATGDELPSVKNADGSITVTLDKPRDFIVRLDGETRFDNDLGRILCVFADEPEMRPFGKDVIFMDAGLHEGDITVTGGKTLYLSPGAVVKGKIKAKGTNTKVLGRGLVLDPNEGTNTDGNFMLSIGPAYNAEIKDVKVASRSQGCFNVTMSGSDGTLVDGVRVMGSVISDDGISVFGKSDDVWIKDCFIYNVDDALVLGGTAGKNVSEAKVTGCLIGTSCSVFAVPQNVGIVKAKGNTAFELASGNDQKHGLVKNIVDPAGECRIPLLKIEDFDSSKSNVTAGMMWLQGCGSKYEKNIKLINVKMREPDAEDIGKGEWNAKHYDIYQRSFDGVPESSNYNISVNGLYYDGTKVTQSSSYNKLIALFSNVLIYVWDEDTNRVNFLEKSSGIPEAPTDVCGEELDGMLRISWTEKNIDTEYRIYRNGVLAAETPAHEYYATRYAEGDEFTVTAVNETGESAKSAAYVCGYDSGLPKSDRLAVYKNTHGNSAETSADDNVKASLTRRYVGSPKDTAMKEKIGFDLWHNDKAIMRTDIDPNAAEDDEVVRFYIRPKKMIEAGTNFAGEGFDFWNLTSGGMTVLDLSECAEYGYVTMDLCIKDFRKNVSAKDIYITLGDLKDCTNGDFIATDDQNGNLGNAQMYENLVGVRLSDYYSDSDAGTVKTIKIPLAEFIELSDKTWQYSYAGVERGINLGRFSYIGYIWAPSDKNAEYDDSAQMIYADNISIENIIPPTAEAVPNGDNTTAIKWRTLNSDITRYSIFKNGKFYAESDTAGYIDSAEAKETDVYSVDAVNGAGYKAYSVKRTSSKLWEAKFSANGKTVTSMCAGDITVSGKLYDGVSGRVVVCRYDKEGVLKETKMFGCGFGESFEHTLKGCAETDMISVYLWSGAELMLPKSVQKTLTK